jgi:Domain of unknown function (DUF1707)
VRTEDRITDAGRSHRRVRASDSDRERVLDMLKAAFVQGRLTKHEFDVRVGQTLLARTFGELTAVTADILAWSIPRPVRTPAKSLSPPAHAVVKAVACAIIALAAIAMAGLPAMRTKPVPRNMSIAACYAFYDWIGDYSDFSTLNLAVHDAWRGTNRPLAADLAHVRHAYRRKERSPQSSASRHSAANRVGAYTARVVSDCNRN